MTVADTFQAAIDRLEQLKADSTPGEWEGYGDGILVGIETEGDLIADAGDLRVADISMIVTLHRTIDAQVELLRHAVARGLSKVEHGGNRAAVWSNERDALVLALAILEEAS